MVIIYQGAQSNQMIKHISNFYHRVVVHHTKFLGKNSYAHEKTSTHHPQEKEGQKGGQEGRKEEMKGRKGRKGMKGMKGR